MIYIIPITILFIILYASVKKVNVYGSFVAGAKDGGKTILQIFPFLVAITVFLEVFRVSGLQEIFVRFSSPLFNLFGIPECLAELILVRPFSGSASTVILEDLITRFGADHYYVRCASVIMGSSETIFYVSAVYFSETKIKKLGKAIPIALIVSILSAIGSCALVRVL